MSKAIRELPARRKVSMKKKRRKGPKDHEKPKTLYPSHTVCA